MQNKSLVGVLVAVGIGLSHAAVGADGSRSVPGPDTGITKIERMQELPISGMKAVETSTGDMMFMSQNGRFVFRGTVYDMWNKEAIRTYDDVDRVAKRIRFEKLGLNLDDLFAVTMGAGKETVVFVDPKCPYCEKLLQQSVSLQSTYRFRFVVIPVLGEQSAQLTRRLGCAKGAEQQALFDALTTHNYDKLPSEASNCDLAKLQRNLVTAQLMDISRVPFVVAPDGRVNQGLPKDLKAFLEDSK